MTPVLAANREAACCDYRLRAAGGVYEAEAEVCVSPSKTPCLAADSGPPLRNAVFLHAAKPRLSRLGCEQRLYRLGIRNRYYSGIALAATEAPIFAESCRIRKELRTYVADFSGKAISDS